MNGRVIILLIGLVGIWWQLTGCAVRDETLYIAEVVEVRIENNKPKVRVASGFDECRWRGKVRLQAEEYEIWFKCQIPFRF